MKNIPRLLLCSLVATTSQAMETQRSYDFLTPEEVLRQSESLPEEFASAPKWVENHAALFRQLQLSEVCHYAELLWKYDQAHKEVSKRELTNLGKRNFIFAPDQSFVVRCAGLYNQFCSKLSSSGTGPISKNYGIIINGRLQFRNEVVRQATCCHTPCHQATSSVAYYLLMKKHLQGKKIQPVPSYPVQYGGSSFFHDGNYPSDFHDGNYVVIQPYLGETYVTLDKLPTQELDQVITQEVLDDFADAVDAGALVPQS